MAGIIRRIDELGRVVLPMEYRKKLKIGAHSQLEMILTDDGDIIIRTVPVEKCDLCANEGTLHETSRGGLICRECAHDVYDAMNRAVEQTRAPSE